MLFVRFYLTINTFLVLYLIVIFGHGSLLMKILILMPKFDDLPFSFEGMFGNDMVTESGEMQESKKNSPVSSKTGIQFLLILYNHSTILRNAQI